MEKETKQILLRQPAYTLAVNKYWDAGKQARHAFVMYPTALEIPGLDDEGVTLLLGRGHDVSRRDIHYAVYLFQRFHLNHGNSAVVNQA